MSEFIKRELLWLITTALIAPILGIILLYLLAITPEQPALTENEKIFEMELYLVVTILGFVSIYFLRLIVWVLFRFILKK